MPPAPLGSHGSDGSLRPLPGPGTQVGRSLSLGHWELENELDQALLPAATPGLLLYPQSQSLLLLLPGSEEGAISAGCQARAAVQPHWGLRVSSPPLQCFLPRHCPVPPMTHPIPAGNKLKPELFLRCLGFLNGGRDQPYRKVAEHPQLKRSHVLPTPGLGGRKRP